MRMASHEVEQGEALVASFSLAGQQKIHRTKKLGGFLEEDKSFCLLLLIIIRDQH